MASTKVDISVATVCQLSAICSVQLPLERAGVREVFFLLRSLGLDLEAVQLAVLQLDCRRACPIAGTAADSATHAIVTKIALSIGRSFFTRTPS